MSRIYWKNGTVILLALLGLIVFVWANHHAPDTAVLSNLD